MRFVHGRKSMKRFLFVGLWIFMLGSLAQAQESEQEVSYKRKTVINFEDDTIEGSLQTPDGQYLEARKKMRHRSLIRIRRHFREKVLGSVNGL